jgi:hypothetical protein
MSTSTTLAQKSNVIGFPKAGELIEIAGAHALTSSDRAILNLLYQHAHDSGRLGEENAEWEIPLGSLGYTRHESNDHVRVCLLRLMRVCQIASNSDPFFASNRDPSCGAG